VKAKRNTPGRMLLAKFLRERKRQLLSPYMRDFFRLDYPEFRKRQLALSRKLKLSLRHFH